LRNLENVYYDLSFSLQYLSDTSCFLDLIKLIKYTNKNKIMFGSDHHWASAKFQFEILNGIFDKLQLNQEEKQKILYDNSQEVFFG
jgi:predicted TIM-barrel fold metal-dependent hydrolase